MNKIIESFLTHFIKKISNNSNIKVKKSLKTRSKLLDSSCKEKSTKPGSDDNKKKLKHSKTDTTTTKKKKEDMSAGSSLSPFSYFFSMMPNEILGVQVTEIKKDLHEGRSQISSL